MIYFPSLRQKLASVSTIVFLLILFIVSMINYFSNGSKAYSKERVEVYSRERVFVCDNFITTRGYGVKGFKNLKTRLDKGHKKQFSEYISRIQSGGEPLIPFDEIINVTKASFAAIQSLREKKWVDIG